MSEIVDWNKRLTLLRVTLFVGLHNLLDAYKHSYATPSQLCSI